MKAERLDGTFRVESLFTEVLDVFGRPSKNFLKDLSKVAPDGPDRDRLSFLVSDAGRDAFTEEIVGESLTFAEVLLKFPSARPTLNQLLTMLPIWMDCSISPGSFQFGEPEVPMVMTGTGTGVAPFLAFAKDRAWYVNKHGPARAGEMWLFFGCRNKGSDYILGDELEELEEKGILTHLRPAFSRDGPKKVYIQDRIKEEAVGLYSALVEKRGYLYLCGQAGDREKDVLNSVAKAFELGGGLTPEQSQHELEQLIDEGRYCPELY